MQNSNEIAALKDTVKQLVDQNKRLIQIQETNYNWQMKYNDGITEIMSMVRELIEMQKSTRKSNEPIEYNLPNTNPVSTVLQYNVQPHSYAIPNQIPPQQQPPLTAEAHISMLNVNDPKLEQIVKNMDISAFATLKKQNAEKALAVLANLLSNPSSLPFAMMTGYDIASNHPDLFSRGNPVRIYYSCLMQLVRQPQYCNEASCGLNSNEVQLFFDFVKQRVQ
ncbi:hypothetical protein PCE1_002010 [Barthelona sp. PCE]